MNECHIETQTNMKQRDCLSSINDISNRRDAYLTYKNSFVLFFHSFSVVFHIGRFEQLDLNSIYKKKEAEVIAIILSAKL